MKQAWRVLYPVFLYEIIIIGVSTALIPLDVFKCMLIGALVSIPVFFLRYLHDQKKRGDVFWVSISPKQAFYVAVCGVGSCFLLNNIITISDLALLFPGIDQVNDILYAPSLWMQIITIGLVIPIVEELLFRGLVFGRLRDVSSFKKAMWLSAICFGFVHGNVVQGMYGLGLGLILAWVYEQCQTIVAPILFHSTANISAVLYTNSMKEYQVMDQAMGFYAITILSGILVVMSMRKIKKQVHKKEELS